MVLTTVIITDLTRMKGNRVCIAGITDDYRTIRPEFDRGVITEDWLFDHTGKIVIRPFARVQLDLLKSCPAPPHTEDWLVRPDIKHNGGLLTWNERKTLLQKILDPSVAAIFGAEIHREPGCFIRENEGTRSLGTVKVKYLEDVTHRCYDGKWDYRISFYDQAGVCYRLGVTDLAFRAFVNHLRETQGLECAEIGPMLERKFRRSDVFLRIGLARPTWEKYPHCCFLQINGVYTFPDYLQGKCFADFSSDIKN